MVVSIILFCVFIPFGIVMFSLCVAASKSSRLADQYLINETFEDSNINK